MTFQNVEYPPHSTVRAIRGEDRWGSSARPGGACLSRPSRFLGGGQSWRGPVLGGEPGRPAAGRGPWRFTSQEESIQCNKEQRSAPGLGDPQACGGPVGVKGWALREEAQERSLHHLGLCDQTMLTPKKVWAPDTPTGPIISE